MGRFSKSEDDGLYRSYARGLWEVVPGHRFPDGPALVAHLRATNPAGNFNNGTGRNDNYRYTMASTGETVLIDKLLGSSKTAQTILRIWAADGTDIPLNRYLMDLRDHEELRQLPLLDVWQVDRDYAFTGEKYAHADGRGRVTVHNPFVGETLVIDASDYRSPKNEVRPAAVQRVPLPAISGTAGQEPQVLALAVDEDHVYATHSFTTEQLPVPTVPGEVVALDRHSMAVTGRVTVGLSPHRMTCLPEHRRLYVANYHDVPASVSVVDTDTFSLVDTLTFPGFPLFGMAVSHRFGRVFMAQPGQDLVHVLDGPTGRLRTPLSGVTVNGEIVVDDATDRLFVLGEHPQNPQWQELVELEITERGQRALRRITLDRQESVAPALAVDDRQVYVCNKGPGGGGGLGNQKVTVVDRATFTLRGPIPLPNLGLALANSTSQRVLYVGTSAEVRSYDTTHLQQLGRTPLPGGQLKVALGVHEPSGAVYFSGTRNGSVSAPVTPPLGR